MNEETVEFRLVSSNDLPPIMITMNDDDRPKVVVNADHRIWLSLHRKTIGGAAESLFHKINEMLTAYLLEQRQYELIDNAERDREV